MSRTEGDPTELSERFAERRDKLPQQCRGWLELSWFQHVVIALDPVEVAVYLDEVELHFKCRVSEFDHIPFAGQAGEWSHIFEEAVEEDWSARGGSPWRISSVAPGGWRNHFKSEHMRVLECELQWSGSSGAIEMSDFMVHGDLIRLYGIDGVVIYPVKAACEMDSVTAEFLGAVGLPSGRVFTSRAGVAGSERDPYVLGPLFDLGDRYCPPESRSWHVLGYLPSALIVLDPHSGAVYIFQESERDYQLAHRDVASLVHCLLEFRKLDDSYKAAYPDSLDVESLVNRFREEVEAVDPTPLIDSESEWNRMLGEVLEEMW
ncbi:SUKH-4 family immunity protein [Streptomyces cyaneofuscatus]